MELTIDRDRCEGTGFCVRLLPGIVTLDDHRRAVLRGPVGDADADELREAEAMCPTNALRLRGDR